MDISRQARSRAQIRDQFENILKGLPSFCEESSSTYREFFQCQSGVEESMGALENSALMSGDHMLDSMTSVFTYLLLSADNLIQMARNSVFDSISLYGEDFHFSLEKDCGGMMEVIANYLPQLHQISEFIHTSQAIAENLLLQIHGFANLTQGEFPNSKEFPLARMWRTLGDLLSTFIVMNELIQSHPFLHEHWNMFIRSIQLAQHNPTQFDLDGQSGRLQQLNFIVSQVDFELMNGNILKNSCKRFLRFDDLTSDRSFMDIFRHAIFDMLRRWERMCTVTDQTIPDKQRLLSLLSLATLYHNMLPQKQQPDRKMIRQLCATHKILVTCHLVGDLLFTPFDFIFKQIPTAEQAIDRKTISAISQLKKSQLDRQLEQIVKDVRMFQQNITAWKDKMAGLEEFSQYKNGHPPGEIAIEKCDIILEGAQIADRASRLLKCILNGHLAEEKPISKTNVCQIFHLIEAVKEISDNYNAHCWPSVLEWANYGCAHYASSLLCLLETNIRNAQTKQPRLASAFQNAELALSQSISRPTLVMAGVSLELANYLKTFHGNDSSLVDENLQRLDIISNFGSILAQVTDLSFLYWHRISLMETYCVNLIQDSDPNIHKAKNFFDAINDCFRPFLNSKCAHPQNIIQTCSNELFAILKKNFLDKLCTEIENDLRISYHAQQNADLEMTDRLLCPTQTQEKNGNREGDTKSMPETLPRLLHLLRIPEIKFGQKIVNVNNMVVSYLESTFYNLSVIALHDCETYRRMQILAKFRYGLNLMDTELPTRSVDQGLDAISIMRDVEKFINNYCYDLDEQSFIECQSSSKHLGVVRVQQIVNSMATHGIGILNPLINSAYKCMRFQFQCLSQCLFEDKIKSILIREIRFYRDFINQLDQKYPVSQAEKMANCLRRYNSTKVDGNRLDFLEKFRVLVIRIGNIIGLVRIFRAGIVETCSPNILLGYHQKEPMIQNLNNTHHPLQFEFAKLCDRLSQNVSSNLRENNDSIELMTSVFAKEFRGNEKFAHLRHFFILIPALMLAHIEYILKCRSRLVGGRSMDSGSSTSSGFVFVDDGFNMGIAYILTLLNQQFFFNSLNWFDSLIEKLQADIDQCGREHKEAQRRKDESLIRILTVKMNHLRERMGESRQGMCSLNSALTFLQANEVGEEDSDETYLDDF